MSKNRGQSPSRAYNRGRGLKMTTNQGNKLNKANNKK